ncbi:uncharacterized protein COLE_05485 [Cutaneotrichosporon oleaginosum]|uniref:uncharacterized protein n=1 Tax=Cutaneotrichosporon oleaginosum TaxID=879819 RepID=UPI00132B9907|nr:hypothetical protein COLE_05485 [Cutaneotrichosporon oleaginosum]
MHGVDYSAYPHIIDQVLSHADTQGLNAFRCASRAAFAKVEAIYLRRARHVTPCTGRDGRVVFPSCGALPSLTIADMEDLTSGAHPVLRRRYSAVKVVDLGPKSDLGPSRCSLRRLLDGIHTVRIVGDLSGAMPFAPAVVVVPADLGRPEPFRGWQLADSLVVNFTVGAGGALAIAFFPPSGYYGPTSLTLLFTRCLRSKLQSLPHGARLGARLMADLARVVCDGHAVTLVDWDNVSALFPPATRPEDVEQLRTWGGQYHKAARRSACIRRLARLAFEPGCQNEDEGEKIRCLTADEYRCEIGGQAYADQTEGLHESVPYMK